MPERFPRLSTDLPNTPSSVRCQACGNGLSSRPIQIWNEHDDSDMVDSKHFVALCIPCSNDLVEPHARLYSRTPENAPLPGAMRVCSTCQHANGLACTSPLLKGNGGPGLLVRHSEPMTALVDGTRNGRRCGWSVAVYRDVPTCDGYEQEVPIDA